jgi:Flp pilus assembly pilin Flp
MGIQRSLRRLSRAEEGVSAVEFAVVAPAVVLLIFGIIELAMIMVVYNVMESATTLSSRLGKTGFVGEGITRQATLLASIEHRAGMLIEMDDITVTSKVYKQFDQINDPEPYTDANGNGSRDSGEAYTDINGNGQWDADMGTAGYGNAGDVVVYSVSYPWSIATPIMREFIGTNGDYTITTHAVVKNEPY